HRHTLTHARAHTHTHTHSHALLLRTRCATSKTLCKFTCAAFQPLLRQDREERQEMNSLPPVFYSVLFSSILALCLPSRGCVSNQPLVLSGPQPLLCLP